MCRSADFLFLAKLEEGELIAIEKGYPGIVPTTSVSITRSGRAAIERHWKSLEKLRADALQWEPEGTTS